MSISEDDVSTIASGGGTVRTVAGDKVGKIGQVYLDDDSGRPSWVTVKTGLFGTQESFVPLPGADLDGVDVVVPYDKDTIKGAPRLDSDGSLTPQEEKRLYAYYFEASTLAADQQRSAEASPARDSSPVTPVAARHDDDRDDDGDRDRRDDDGDRDRRDDDGDRDRRDDDRDRDRHDEDRGRDRATDDDAGSDVGTPRLRKYVVTEKVIPVSREEVAADDSERGGA